MSKKDIAFSTLGIIVTLLFSWLLYRHEQANAAAAVAATADAAASNQSGVYTQSYPSDGGLSEMINSGSLATSNYGSTDTTATTGTDATANGTSLLEKVLDSYTAANAPAIQPSLIPTINSGVNLSLADVPTTPGAVLGNSPLPTPVHTTALTGQGV